MKKFTLLITLLVCSVGFSQSSLSSYVEQNPNTIQQRTNQDIPTVDYTPSDILSNLPVGYENLVQQRTVAEENQELIVNTVVNNNYLTGVFSYSEYVNSGNTQTLTSNRPTVVVNSNRNSGVIDTYTDLPTWQANVGGALVSEDFGGGLPGGGISACGPIINSTGDGTCFLAGEIEEGFDLTASVGDVVYIGPGAIGNTSVLVGANTFADFTILTFTGPDPVFEVAHDIWNNSDPDTDYRVFDTGGILIQSFNLNNTVATENFFGIISPLPIGHIEIDGLNASGELFGNFKFTAPGGGGGGPCSQVNPSNGFENAFTTSSNGPQIIATDITVDADVDFTLETMTVNILATVGETITSADIIFYNDLAGVPDAGSVINSQLGVVPTSQSVIGNAFGFDVNEVIFDITPELLAGQAGIPTSYWTSIYVTTSANGNGFIDSSTVGVMGFEQAFSPDAGVTWLINGGWDTVYDFAGQCLPIGGGGGGCAAGVYTDRAAWDTETAGGTITFEDFDGGPGGILQCGVIIDSTGDGACYPPGEIQPGIQITSNNSTGGQTVYVEAGNFGLPNDAVGSNTFVDYTIINFPNNDVNSFAFDLYGLIGGATIDVRIFGTGGLIDTQTVTALDPAGVFFGYIASETVVSLELEDLSGGAAELVAQFAFGECIAGGSCVNVQYDAAGLPLDIDPGGTQTVDCVGAPNLYPVTVTGSGTIGTDSNVDNVTLNITHTWDGDLDISLVSPTGTELLLSGGNGGSGDNYTNTVFMDGGADITAGAPPFTGTFEPEGGTFAAAFNGEAITGDWNLKICDNAGGDTGTVDTFSISICSPVPSDNDLCVDAFPVACGDVVVSETITNTDTGGNPAPDEWYSFTGTGTAQVVTVSLCDGGTDYDSFLRVFDACGGTQIASNDDFCGLQSQLSFASDGTSTYYIMVEGFASNSGNFSMEITCVDAPPNDDCTGAISMSCGETVVGETNTATFDATAPVCVTGITAPGVWYEFTDTTGLVTNYTLSMCDGGTDYDSKITVYSGDCGALACVVDNDDTCGLQSEVQWQGDGLTTYYILVHGFASNTGNFSMALTCAPVPPPNDMIVNSIDVDEIGFPYTDPAVAMPAATTENGNPTGCNIDGANGVWYNFVPDGDGFATAEIITPGGASAVTFYTAPDENSMETDLTLVDFNGNQCVPGTSAIIPTTAGQAYYVFVLNNGAITDIVIDGNNLGTSDNTIQGFTYYPNPTDGVLNLNAVDNIDNVAIYNLLGQQVLNQNVEATSAELNVSNLAVGAYIMKVSVNGEIGTYKVIKR